MFKAIKEFFFGKAIETKTEEVQYKIETPAMETPLVKLGPEKTESEPTTTKKKPAAKKQHHSRKPKNNEKPKSSKKKKEA